MYSYLVTVIANLLIRKKEGSTKSKFCFWIPSPALTFKTGCSNLPPVPVKQGNKSMRLILNSEEHGSYSAKGDQKSIKRSHKGEGGTFGVLKGFRSNQHHPELRGLLALRSFCKLKKILRKSFTFSVKC